MKICRAKKLHECKRCYSDIWPNAFYYPQRKNKSLCLHCGRMNKKTLIGKFLTWLGSHGSC
ncbi:MAG: hypothetical protein QM500_19025 [Methylococcales bacterium]